MGIQTHGTKAAGARTGGWRGALSAERIAHLIKHAFRGTSRALQRRLSEHAVSYSQWTLLRVLWQTDGLTQRQLSEAAGVTEPSTFTAVHAMEELGYVTRQKMPDNQKQVRVYLTGKGSALRDVIVATAEEVNRIALAGIPMQDVAITRRTLIAMIQNLERDEHASRQRSVTTRSARPRASVART